MSASDITQISDNMSKFDFISDIGDFFSQLMSDIIRLIQIMPSWLQTIVFVVVGIMIFAVALRCVAFVLDAIPFV